MKEGRGRQQHGHYSCCQTIRKNVKALTYCACIQKLQADLGSLGSLSNDGQKDDA
jgi:hypothetical protein